MAADRKSLVKNFITDLPFCAALRLRLVEVGDGLAVLELPYSKALVGDPFTGVIHGGAVSALMDTAGGAAVICHPDAGVTTATLDLRIDYLRSAKPGKMVTARAECFHVTRSVAFMRATAWDVEPSDPLATAAGTFTVDQVETPEGAVTRSSA